MLLSPSEADTPASLPSHLPAPRLFHTSPLSGGSGGVRSLKSSDLKMGKKNKGEKKNNNLIFLLNRPAITALRLVYHYDHVFDVKRDATLISEVLVRALSTNITCV